MKSKDFGALLLLAALWGASFLFMRIATPVIGPFLTIELRVLLAAGALLIYALVTKTRFNFRGKWKEYLLLGAVNAGIPFTLICTAELHLDASLAAILNATTPLFTVLIEWKWLKISPNWKKVIGLIMGVVGVSILMGFSPIPLDKKILFSVCFSLLAALFYGYGGIYASRKFKGVKPLEVTIGQQLGASIVLFPFAMATLPNKIPPLDVILSILGLSIFCTSLAYLIYFRLMNNVGPVKTLSVTFLVPAFGILWGRLFLHEFIYVNTIIGLLIIFASISLVTNIVSFRGERNRQ